MADIVFLPSAHPNGVKKGPEWFASGDSVTVGKGLTWTADTLAVGAGAVRDFQLRVEGSVSTLRDGADLGGPSGELRDSRVVVVEEAVLGGFRFGLNLAGGRDNSVVNHGLIGGTDAAIRSSGGLTIENAGLIGSAGDTLVDAERYHAINHVSGTVRVVNDGVISGVDKGLPSWRQAVIKAENAARLDLSNREGGTVISEWSGPAVMGGASGDVVTNRGAILGDIALREGDDLLVHEGSIAGQATLGAGDDTARLGPESNITGGDLDLGAGDDLVEVEAGATISGGITGGPGDDTYILAFGEDITIFEEADGGHDTLHVGGEYGLDWWIEDVVLLDAPAGVPSAAVGNDSDNDMRGSSGQDLVLGGEGDDRIKGRGGDDRLRGDRGDDRLGGGRGDDRLEGGAGDDRLSGGRGDDLLIGGKGDDRLRGGEGADVFQWKRAAERERDVVRDFETGVDELDLLALDLTPQADDRGRAELRVVERDDRTVLRADTDGDGEHDFRIVLKGVTGLDADDLLL